MRFLFFINVLISTFLPSVLAANTCGSFLVPANGTCNVGPDSDSDLEALVVLDELVPGDCRLNLAILAVTDKVYEYGSAIYTGLDGLASTVPALNTITNASPGILGTYTLSFPVANTAISGGSPVTVSVTYWGTIPFINKSTAFSTIAATFTQIHSPTITAIATTMTLTTPVQVFTGKCVILQTTVLWHYYVFHRFLISNDREHINSYLHSYRYRYSRNITIYSSDRNENYQSRCPNSIHYRHCYTPNSNSNQSVHYH
jgi:hypothetical protein